MKNTFFILLTACITWSCTLNKPKAYIGVYNISESHDCSGEAYIEIALPVNYESILKMKDNHCVIGLNQKVGSFFSNKQEIHLLNNVDAPKNTLYKTVPEIANNKMPVVFLYKKSYIGYSLQEIDDDLQKILDNLELILYTDKNGTLREILKDIDFKYYYFLDHKQVDKESKEFMQKMHIDLPPPIKASPLQEAGFNTKAWEQDSLACNGFRAKHYNSVLKHKSWFIGKEDTYITTHLGEPNFINDRKGKGKELIYIIEPHPFCRDKNISSKAEAEVANIYVVVNENDMVTKMGVVVP